MSNEIVFRTTNTPKPQPVAGDENLTRLRTLQRDVEERARRIDEASTVFERELSRLDPGLKEEVRNQRTLEARKTALAAINKTVVELHEIQASAKVLERAFDPETIRRRWRFDWKDAGIDAQIRVAEMTRLSGAPVLMLLGRAQDALDAGDVALAALVGEEAERQRAQGTLSADDLRSLRRLTDAVPVPWVGDAREVLHRIEQAVDLAQERARRLRGGTAGGQSAIRRGLRELRFKQEQGGGPP